MITESNVATPALADDRALAAPSTLMRLMRTRATWVLLLDFALFALFTATSRDHIFFSAANAENLLMGMTQALLLALGLAMLLGAGIFDLSLGANLVLSSVIGATVVHHFRDGARHYSHPWLAIVTGIAVCVIAGAVYGLINGLLIAYANVNSLIATLATMGIGTGASFLIAPASADISGMPLQLRTAIGKKAFFHMPVPALVALGVAALLWAVVRFTRFGMRTQSIGSSRTAAERAGINVKRHYIQLTMLGGALAGVAGSVDLARFGSTALIGHGNDSLAAVAAVVIGGTMLQGGYISIAGAVWGSALAVILQQGLVISGVQSFWQMIVIGAVLLFAVVFDRITVQRRAARR
jgi:ribose transport system permease protein